MISICRDINLQITFLIMECKNYSDIWEQYGNMCQWQDTREQHAFVCPHFVTHCLELYVMRKVCCINWTSTDTKRYEIITHNSNNKQFSYLLRSIHFLFRKKIFLWNKILKIYSLYLRVWYSFKWFSNMHKIAFLWYTKFSFDNLF